MGEYSVFVKTDEEGRIIDINSSAFLSDTEGWTLIDSGDGDKYHHAQWHYLETPLMNDRCVWIYKLVDGVVERRTQEEIEADIIIPPEPEQSVEQRCEALEKAFAALVGGVEDARN